MHEGLGFLWAWRLARAQATTFSVAVNDYGFELLAPRGYPWPSGWRTPPPAAERPAPGGRPGAGGEPLGALPPPLPRDRPGGGLVRNGYPGQPRSGGQLQISAALLFDVFERHEPATCCWPGPPGGDGAARELRGCARPCSACSRRSCAHPAAPPGAPRVSAAGGAAAGADEQRIGAGGGCGGCWRSRAPGGRNRRPGRDLRPFVRCRQAQDRPLRRVPFSSGSPSPGIPPMAITLPAGWIRFPKVIPLGRGDPPPGMSPWMFWMPWGVLILGLVLTGVAAEQRRRRGIEDHTGRGGVAAGRAEAIRRRVDVNRALLWRGGLLQTAPGGGTPTSSPRSRARSARRKGISAASRGWASPGWCPPGSGRPSWPRCGPRG